ncbi:MAG: hypothetical protein Q9160_003011 [Pyrenula sp. 1 TL-2023]
MMVPRPYAIQTRSLSPKGTGDQKKRTLVSRPSKDRANKIPAARPSSPDHTVSTTSPPSPTSPVSIPLRRNSQAPTDRNEPVSEKPPRPQKTLFEGSSANIPRAYSAASVDSILTSTAIRPRRSYRPRKSQRLPDCDHVAEFSKLLLDDVGSREEGISGSFGNPHFDLIFGSLNENDGEEISLDGDDEHPEPVPPRSISSESMPSLEIDNDSTTTTSLNEIPTPSLAGRRALSEKQSPQISTSVGLSSDDHPLKTPVLRPSSPTVDLPDNLTPPPKSRASSTIRSNLTASIRALKSAAQSVSNIKLAPPLQRPDDFLSRSIFDISPTLTDDKRPPPLSAPPSPALRRYLNPSQTTATTLTPSDISTYHDFPQNRPSPTSSSVQLQTYLPPTHRSANASSPPIFPASTSPSPESSLTLFTGPNLARQRELRENSDFLRVLVCEMEMRRSGKLRDDVEGRACVWLPPRITRQEGDLRNGSERFRSWTL